MMNNLDRGIHKQGSTSEDNNSKAETALSAKSDTEQPKEHENRAKKLIKITKEWVRLTGWPWIGNRAWPKIRVVLKSSAFWTALATVAIAILTGYYTDYARKQWKAMNAQLAEMQEDRRPWIFVTDSCMTPTAEYRKNLSPPTCPGQGHFFDNWRKGETLTWWIEISNTGRTPTETDLTASLCEFKEGEYPAPEDESCKQLKTIQRRPVSPGKVAGIVIGPSEYRITDQELQRVQDGDRLAIVARSRYSFGHTTYTDHFCLWYEPHGIQPLRFCEGTKYNYEEKKTN